jgi:hypothetical protein
MAVVIMLGLILVAAVMAAMRQVRHHEPGLVLLAHVRPLFEEQRMRRSRSLLVSGFFTGAPKARR